ncbi:PilW family protein [Glaciimonas sp. GG7]
MSGFSLIELMIAIAVSLFLLAAMIAIVLTLRNSFGTQDAQSRVQESQRFALTVLDNTVRASGYYTNPTTTTANNALPAASTANPDGTTFAMAQGISGTSGSGNASDTLNIRFQTASGDGLMDCLGDTNTSGSAVAWSNSFAVNAANQLTCAVSINGGTPGTASILVDNVSSMKVLYGVDTTGVGSTDTYLSASAVTTGGYWPVVQSVQVQINFVDLVNSTATTTKILPVMVHMINLMNKA